MNACPHDLSDLLADEATEAERRHVADCARCVAALEALRATQALVTAVKPESEAVPDFEGVWSRLEPRLDAVDRSRRRLALPVWLSAAAVLLLALWTLRETGPTPTQAKPQPPAELVSFFDRAQPFLLTLANVNPRIESEDDLAMIREDRDRAARLAVEARTLDESPGAWLSLDQRSLLADIELLLLQVANLRESEYPSGLEMVRTFMARRTILFELTLFDEGVPEPLTRAM